MLVLLVIGSGKTYFLFCVSTCPWCDGGRNLLKPPAAISEAECGSSILTAMQDALYRIWTFLPTPSALSWISIGQSQILLLILTITLKSNSNKFLRYVVPSSTCYIKYPGFCVPSTHQDENGIYLPRQPSFHLEDRGRKGFEHEHVINMDRIIA